MGRHLRGYLFTLQKPPVDLLRPSSEDKVANEGHRAPLDKGAERGAEESTGSRLE
jgi:hypothetical protein